MIRSADQKMKPSEGFSIEFGIKMKSEVVQSGKLSLDSESEEAEHGVI